MSCSSSYVFSLLYIHSLVMSFALRHHLFGLSFGLFITLVIFPVILIVTPQWVPKTLLFVHYLSLHLPIPQSTFLMPGCHSSCNLRSFPLHFYDSSYNSIPSSVHVFMRFKTLSLNNVIFSSFELSQLAFFHCYVCN